MRYEGVYVQSEQSENTGGAGEGKKEMFKKQVEEFREAQQVKDPVLSVPRLRSLLWHGFDPWPRNFCEP